MRVALAGTTGFIGSHVHQFAGPLAGLNLVFIPDAPTTGA
jgi:hypothetical protein